jgi:hypothetical protein
MSAVFVSLKSYAIGLWEPGCAPPELRVSRPACVSTNPRVALCKERAPGALHVRQEQHKGLRIK